MSTPHALRDAIAKDESGLLDEWLRYQLTAVTLRRDLMSDLELRDQSRRFLSAMRGALASTDATPDIARPEWTETRELLGEVSRSRARQGYSPSETATFVFSLKQPLFDRLRAAFARDAEGLGDSLWQASNVIDGLGLITSETYQAGREEVISRQQQEMLELSTPVVELWQGVLALPLIGTLDSARTQIVMESLLGKIVATGASIAIIDITGVPTRRASSRARCSSRRASWT